MSATMTMQSYQCQEMAKDWSLYFEEEGIPEKMAEVFRTWQIDYILAECKQDDGLTLCFIQTTKPWERSIIVPHRQVGRFDRGKRGIPRMACDGERGHVPRLGVLSIEGPWEPPDRSIDDLGDPGSKQGDG